MTEEVTTPTATPQADAAARQPEAPTQTTTAAPTGVSSAYGDASTPETPTSQSQSQPSADQQQSTGDPMMDLVIAMLQMWLMMRQQRFDEELRYYAELERAAREGKTASVYDNQNTTDQQTNENVAAQEQKSPTDAVNAKMEKMGDELSQSIGKEGVTVEVVKKDQLPEYVQQIIAARKSR